MNVGDTLFWIEKMCRASDLVGHQQIVVIHHSPYGFTNSGGDRLEVDYVLCEFYESSSRF